MNDDQQQPSEKRVPVQPASPAAAAGAMLRQARESAGIHLAALAVSLKVPPARLEALEAGRIDLLPDVVFARALAASICRTLKLDPEPVLKQLPRTMTAASPGAVKTESDRRQLKPQAAQPAADARRSGMSAKPFLIGALVFVLAALALVFVPDLSWERFTASRSPADTPAASSGSQPPSSRSTEVVKKPAASPAASAPTTATTAAQALATAPAPAPGANESTAATAGGGATAKPTETAAAPAASAPAGALPATDTVVFRTQTDAWISVTDAKGTSLIRKTVPAGQTVGVSSDALPLRVTVGRADVTKVSVRGEPLDLAPMTKGSVARFEVK